MTGFRDERGRWAAGNGGRPVGARGKASRAMLEQIRAMGPLAIVQLSQALNRGERWAVEAVLERILPSDRVIELEAATSADVAEGLAAGDLSPAEAAALATTLVRLHELQAIDRQPKTVASRDYEVLEGDSQEVAAEKYRKLLGE